MKGHWYEQWRTVNPNAIFGEQSTLFCTPSSTSLFNKILASVFSKDLKSQDI